MEGWKRSELGKITEEKNTDYGFKEESCIRTKRIIDHAWTSFSLMELIGARHVSKKLTRLLLLSLVSHGTTTGDDCIIRVNGDYDDDDDDDYAFEADQCD